ncbi:MAG: VIT and VWA domain-containing protein [Anaerolineae bacterium]|nr:VIT and VWA domain-containing protein [Anaerolineae bacterium]
MARARSLILCSLTLLSLYLPQAVLADGMVLPLEASTAYLVVLYHHVTVDIVDTRAVTHVEQAFYNPHPFEVTAQYLFPVPPEAVVTGFEAVVDGEAQTASRQDAAATNAALTTLVAQRRDPSLFQYADWTALTFELVLPAHATRTMSLEYDEVLAPANGMAHYRYILGTERYTSELLDEVSMTVRLTSSQGLGTIYSSSHPVSIERQGAGRAEVTWEAEDVQPTEDFHLFFSPAEGGFGSGLLLGRQPDADGETQGAFLFLFAPERARHDSPALPKDIVFVVDRSGSMEGEKMVQAQDALQYILGQLGSDDRFSIVGFDDRLDVLATTLQPVTSETIRGARDFVDDLFARDATDIAAALEEGLEVLRSSEPRRGAMRLLVFLTDGLPTAGLTDTGDILRRIERDNRRVEARLHVFGVGYDVNTHLLDQLATAGGGSITYVQPGENLELVLSAFYGRIASPLLTDLEITFDGMVVEDVHPQSLPDMFEGSSLLLTGRYRPRGGTATVHVTARAGEEKQIFEYDFDLEAAETYAFVPRLWATRQIGQLLDEIRVKGERDVLVAEVRDLGLTYGLVTPYTTFAIAAQAGGAASVENMALYGDQSALNQSSGQVTIQARVQNQSYQQAAQANLAGGANVTQSGYHNLAQVNTQHIDLTLLQGREHPDGPVTEAWIERNVAVDRQVDFGSEAYFALGTDPEARAFLQAGNNVLFRYRGEVIQVIDPETPEAAFDLQSPESSGNMRPEQSVPSYTPLTVGPQSSSSPWTRLLQALVGALRSIVQSLAE